MLQMSGLCVSDFDSVDEAMKTADEFVEMSANEYGFTKETIDHPNPLCVKCYYVLGHGKTHTVSGTERKTICGAADLKQKQLIGASDITGGSSVFGKPDADNVKLEFPYFSDMKVEAEKLKSKDCQSWTLN